MAEEGTDFKEIWEEAFSLYQEKTQRDLKNDSVLTNLHSTDDLLKQIGTHEQDFSTFRQRKAKLWAVLRGAMHGVELIGSITENALTLTPFSYASPVLAAVLFLVTAAKGVSEAYDSIINLLSQLEDFTGRLEEYTKAAVEPKLRKKIVNILTTLLEIFARSEKLIKKGRLKQYMSVTFLGGNEKVAQGMERLRSLVDTETRLVGSLTYSTALRTSDTVDRSERVLQRTDKTTERSERKLEGITTSMNDSRRENKEKEEREMLCKALDEKILTKVREKHDDVTERRLSGTGDWIKAEPLYQKWIEEETPMLWILGGPGAGKSFLSSRIISHLQEVHPQDAQRPSRVSVAYFYIKEDDQQLRFVNAILKVVALQLATSDSVFRNFAADVCKSPDNIGTAKRTWDNLFMNFFGSRQSRDSAAFVLIDGLDEAPRKEREIFLQLLYSLEKARSRGSTENPRLQFAMVGRPELRESISSTWDSQIIFIEVSASKNSLDIKNYILKSIDRVKALKLRHIPQAERKKLRTEIIDKLEEGANGMFLWVNLMLDQIYNTSRPSDIVKALNAAPQELDKMIRHVFERIATDPSVNKADLNEILVWVTCAQERLRLGEMDTILKLRPPIGEGMPDLEDRLRGQFASFFTLSRKDNLSTEQLQLSLRDERREKLLHKESHDTDKHAAFSSPSDDLDDEDDEQDQTYESPFDTTYLEFSHASVRDFLLQEGKPETRKWPTDLGVGVEVNEAQHHITAILLGVLCDEKHDTTFAENNLSCYAADHCLFHLQRLDRSALGRSEKRRVIRPLFTAFHDDIILERWIDKSSSPYDLWIRGWLNDNSMSQCVRGWFADEGISDQGFTSEEISQMQIAARSTAALFKPMALYCARKWIGPEANDWNPEFYVWFLHIYLGLDGPDGSNMPDHDVSLERLELSDFSLARLRLLANFGEFEKSSVWHRRFAKIIRDAGYINAALKNFDISLKLNSENWMTMEGVALCYEVRKQYLKAIEWESKALAKVPKGEDEDRAECLQTMSKWRQETGDREIAIQALYEAMCLLPKDVSIIYDYIKLLDIESKFKEIMNLVSKLQEDSSDSKDGDMLSQLLVIGDVQEILGKAAEALGKTDVIMSALERSLATAEHTDLTIGVSERSFGLTKFRSRHVSDSSQAMQLWEELLKKVRPRTSDDGFFYVIRRTLNALSQLYYDEAVAAEANDQDFDVWISKLESIAKPSKAAESAEVYARQDNVLLLGFWYRLHGRLDEARACFKLRMLEAIDILTDEYPENDAYGFELLSRILHKAGDDENAAAAISVSMALIDKLKAARQSGQDTSNQVNANIAIEVNPMKPDSPDEVQQQTKIIDNKAALDPEANVKKDLDKADSNESDGHVALENFDSLDLEAQEKTTTDYTDTFGWTCDGECTRKVEDWQGLYTCDACLDLCFCDQCVELVKGNKLGFRMCNPKHSFWQVYPSDAKFLDVATEKVDGKTVPRAAWLERLREEWAV